MTGFVRNGLFLFIAGFLGSCASKPSEKTAEIKIDTAKYHQVDSVSDVHYKVLKDTILTIKADSVKALYYPNTGRVVMTLKKGDRCSITRTGRYDVVDNKGNFWIRVERMGGKGWIFCRSNGGKPRCSVISAWDRGIWARRFRRRWSPPA